MFSLFLALKKLMTIFILLTPCSSADHCNNVCEEEERKTIFSKFNDIICCFIKKNILVPGSHLNTISICSTDISTSFVQCVLAKLITT